MQGSGYRPGRARPTVVIDSRDFGVKADDVTDSAAALNAALLQCPQGGAVQLPPTTAGTSGAVRISASIVPQPFTQLWGYYGERDQIGSGFPRIKPFSAFTGAAAVRLLDKEEGGFSVDNQGVVLKDLSFDGSALGATVLDAIKATGLVHGVHLENVSAYSFTSHGIETANYTRLDTSVQHPYSWRGSNLQMQTNSGDGFHLLNATDCVFDGGSRADHNAGVGWWISGCANSTFADCRAEWNDRGFWFTGSVPVGGGFGAISVIGASTDRNTRDGFFVDSTGGLILFSSPRATRDGRNAKAGGGGYAGIAASGATTVILINDPGVLPGVDDDTTGTNSPQYGMSFTGNAYVAVDGAGLVQGNTAGFNDGGSNTVLRRGANVVDRSGTTTSPSAINYPATSTYPHALPSTGSYYFPLSADSTSTTATMANGAETAAPFYFPGGTILRIGAEVTVVGDVGSKIRLGIRADGANGQPASAAPLLDAGQIAGDSATVQEITLGSPLTLAPGWYWLTATVQAVTTTSPTIRTGTRPHPYYNLATGTSAPTAGTTVVGRKQTGVTAALPSTWTDGGTVGAMPRLFLKMQ